MTYNEMIQGGIPAAAQVPQQGAVAPVVNPQQEAKPPANPEEQAQRAGGWQQFLTKLQTDPGLQQAAFHVATRMMQGPEQGQSSLGMLGSALQNGQQYLAMERGNERDAALAEEKRKQDAEMMQGQNELRAAQTREINTKTEEVALNASSTRALQEKEGAAADARTADSNLQRQLTKELRGMMNAEEWKAYKMDPQMQGSLTIRTRAILASKGQTDADAGALQAAVGQAYDDMQEEKKRVGHEHLNAVKVQAANALPNLRKGTPEYAEILRIITLPDPDTGAVKKGGAAEKVEPEVGKAYRDKTSGVTKIYRGIDAKGEQIWE